jgi:hypothetical protein
MAMIFFISVLKNPLPILLISLTPFVVGILKPGQKAFINPLRLIFHRSLLTQSEG